MTHRRWSLRWLIGGIYFFIMVVIMGALAIYFSQRTAKNYMDAMMRTERGQAMLGADLLKTNQIPVDGRLVPLGEALLALRKMQARQKQLHDEFFLESKGIPGAERLNPHLAKLQFALEQLSTHEESVKMPLKGMLWPIQINSFASRVVLLDRDGNLLVDSLSLTPNSTIQELGHPGISSRSAAGAARRIGGQEYSLFRHG